MSSLPKSKYITPEQYLAMERQAETKSEYLHGEMFAMTGASRAHNLIVINTGAEARHQLKERDCEVYVSDLRVKVSASSLYTYPDITIVCGEPQFEDADVDTLLNPDVIFEVLSDSTEAYDRGKKFEHYRRLPSLQEYLLVSQDHVHIDHYVRSQTGQWIVSEVNELTDDVFLSTIGCALSVAEMYAKVSFDEPRPQPQAGSEQES